MRTPKKRHTVVAVLALVFAALPAAASLSPAHAAPICQPYSGPTPSVEVDTNNDGNPEVRVPSLSNVSICVQTDASLHGNPVRVENCSEWWGIDCWRVLIHPQAGVTVDSGVAVCRSVDQGPTVCSNVKVGPWTYWTPDQPTMCIGIHLGGGSACSNGQFFGFE